MNLFDGHAPTPEFVARFGETYGATTEAHIDGLRMAALTLVGCLVGPRAHVRKADGDRIRVGPLTWNTLVAAPSGMGRKSTTANTAISLARSANELWRAQGGDQGERDADAPADARENIYLLPGGIGSSGEALTDSIAPPNPASRTLWMQTGPPSCLLALDEAGPLFAPSGKRGPHHESMRRFILETYDGHLSGRRTRVGGAKIGGPCAVSSIGTVTVAELMDCLSVEAVSSGLMGRIVPVRCPMIDESQLQPFWREPDPDHVAALERWLIAAATVERWDVRLSEGAERVWREWYLESWRHYSPSGPHGAEREQEATIFARYQNLAQRLAVALTIADWAPAPWPYVPGRRWRENPPHPPGELTITPETMAVCCLTATEFSKGMVALVDEAMDRTDGFWRYQERLLAYMAEQGQGVRVDRRTLGRAVRAHRYGLSARLADEAREDLIRGGRLGFEVEETRGRPREVYWYVEDDG